MSDLETLKIWTEFHARINDALTDLAIRLHERGLRLTIKFDGAAGKLEIAAVAANEGGET